MKRVLARAGIGLSLVSGGTVIVLAAMTSGAVAAAPAANGDGVQTTVRKSVSISADSSGTPTSSVMVTQLSATGNGTSTVKVPIGVASLRNLDGFSKPPVDGDNAVFNVNVNGTMDEQRIYTKSDPGPVSVKAAITVDGKSVKPQDVVNMSGVLDVTYTVTNNSGTTQQVSYQDAAGNTLTDTVLITDPIGGSATVTLPAGFGEITAPTASIGGDGHGGNTLSFSLALFPPLGNPVGTVHYQARMYNATLPPASFTFLPIVPFSNGSIATAKSAYEGGAASSKAIYDGGVAIADNLQKLQAGALKLMNGLKTAQDGAQQISDGLTTQALVNGNPIGGIAGARAIAGGLEDSIPAAKLLASSTKDQLLPGMQTLASGLEDLQAGINALSITVPAGLAKNPDYLAAQGGFSLLIEGDGKSVLPIKDVIAASQKMATFKGGQPTPPTAGYCGFIATHGGDPTACFKDAGAIQTYLGTAAFVLPLLQDGLGLLATGIVASIKTGLLGNKATPGTDNCVGGAAEGVGLNCIVAGVNGQLLPGIETLTEGVQSTPAKLQEAVNGANALADGLVKAADGATKIADGLGAAVTGASDIASGAGRLKAQGADKLSDGALSGGKGFASSVAVLNVMQEQGLAGKGIPYGKAEGPNTTTTGVYQMTIASPEAPGNSNPIRYALAIIALLLAVGVGTMLWRRNAHGA